MKLARIFFIDIKQLLKNKMFYVKLIVLPLLMIFILGSVFNTNTRIAVFNVAFLNEDAPPGEAGASLGNVLEKDVFGSKDAKSVINLIEVSNDEAGKKMLRDGKAAAYIHIPSGFTQAYSGGEKTGIGLYDDNATALQKNVIHAILLSFINNTDIASKIERIAASVSGTVNPAGNILPDIKAHLTGSGGSAANIPVLPAGAGSKYISAMQFLSVGMMLMFSILMGFVIVHNIVDEKINKTYYRIGTTPTRKIEYALGRMLSISLSMAFQMFLIIVFTTLLYGMDWGNTGLVLLTTLVYAFSIGSAVLVTGLVSRDHMTVSSFSTPLMFALSFVGGTFVSADQFTGLFALFHRAVPNGAANDAFLSIAEGKGLGDIRLCLVKMAGFAMLFILVSVILQKVEGGITYANARNDKKPTETAA